MCEFTILISSVVLKCWSLPLSEDPFVLIHFFWTVSGVSTDSTLRSSQADDQLDYLVEYSIELTSHYHLESGDERITRDTCSQMILHAKMQAKPCPTWLTSTSTPRLLNRYQTLQFTYNCPKADLTSINTHWKTESPKPKGITSVGRSNRNRNCLDDNSRITDSLGGGWLIEANKDRVSSWIDQRKDELEWETSLSAVLEERSERVCEQIEIEREGFDDSKNTDDMKGLSMVGYAILEPILLRLWKWDNRYYYRRTERSISSALPSSLHSWNQMTLTITQ